MSDKIRFTKAIRRGLSFMTKASQAALDADVTVSAKDRSEAIEAINWANYMANKPPMKPKAKAQAA